MSDTPRTDALAKDERHLNHAETVYWCKQYKTKAKILERELAAAQQRIAELERGGCQRVACMATAHDLDVAQERIAELEKKKNRQRTELRRLNRCLGPYWTGFRVGISKEREVRLRDAMHVAFGHKAVLAAEHAAIDAARAKEGK